MLTKLFMNFVLIGAEWVLWLLVALSVISITIAIERAVFFVKHSLGSLTIKNTIVPLLKKRRFTEVLKLTGERSTTEGNIIAAGIEACQKESPDAVERRMSGTMTLEQEKLERRLSFLGTLGNNAPFIGLLGTVLGIIKAFHDLSLDKKGGAEAVMSGISEALVATAVGLFVAIPAVVAYNFFQRAIARRMANSEALAEALLAGLKSNEGCSELPEADGANRADQ